MLRMLPVLCFALISIPTSSFAQLKSASTESLLAAFEQRASELEKLRFAFDGLNCWSTTLYATGLGKRRMYVSDKEFSAVLNSSSSCRRLSPGSEIEPGAIGAIRTLTNGRIEELHGFVTVENDRIFTKIDSTFETQPGYRSLKKDFRAFADAGSTFEDCGPKVSGTKLYVRNSQCQTWVDYYRCQPPHPLDGLQTSAAKFLRVELELISDEVEQQLFSGEAFQESRTIALADRLSKLVDAILALPGGQDQTLLFSTYESLAYQYSALALDQRTRTELGKGLPAL